MTNGAFKLWLEFELSDQWIQDPEDDFFNMHIRIEDGRSYALNVWTFNYFERALAEVRASGESPGSKYLLAPDLFVERLDRPLLEQVAADLIDSGGLKEEWLIPPDKESLT